MTFAKGQTGISYAVLGGKGFVGSAIVRELQARQAQVTVIDREEYEKEKGTSYDIFINANGNSRKFLSAREPALEFDLSVSSVAHSLQDFEYSRYIHLSTIDVYPDHENPDNNTEDAVINPLQLSPYGLHKSMAEQLVRYYANDWLIFRMAGFVGPGLWKNSIYDMLKHQPLHVHPDSAYQYIHCRDLARTVLDMATRNVTGEIFNVAGVGTITLRECAEMIPGYNADACPDHAHPERYEVNTEKIRRYRKIPETRDTVQSFISQVLEDKESIQ